MIDDIMDIAAETRTGTISGIPVMFRAYIDADRTERLVWRVGDTTGNGAMLDKIEGLVILPQGREIEIDDRMTHYLNIPRWLADALMNDFKDFDVESIDPLKDSTDDTRAGVPNQGNTPVVEKDDDEDIKPMFDDIEVDDGSDGN